MQIDKNFVYGHIAVRRVFRKRFFNVARGCCCPSSGFSFSILLLKHQLYRRFHV